MTEWEHEINHRIRKMNLSIEMLCMDQRFIGEALYDFKERINGICNFLSLKFPEESPEVMKLCGITEEQE